MSDTNSTETPAETPAPPADGAGTESTDQTPAETPEGAESAATEVVEGEEAEGTEETGETDDTKLDLDGAKNALSKVRKEAASYRTRLRDAEEALAKATTPEQLEEIKQGLAAANAADSRALLVENVALKHKLPAELAEALKGETREELEKHAKVLAKFAPADTEDDPDLGGGLDASNKPDGEYDPLARVKALRASRF